MLLVEATGQAVSTTLPNGTLLRVAPNQPTQEEEALHGD